MVRYIDSYICMLLRSLQTLINVFILIIYLYLCAQMLKMKMMKAAMRQLIMIIMNTVFIHHQYTIIDPSPHRYWWTTFTIKQEHPLIHTNKHFLFSNSTRGKDQQHHQEVHLYVRSSQIQWGQYITYMPVIYIYIYICIYICIYIYIYSHIYTCIHTYEYTYLLIHMYLRT